MRLGRHRLAAVALALLLVGALGALGVRIAGTHAFMVAGSEVSNRFGTFGSTITETFDPEGGTKRDVYVSNTNTVSEKPLYLRARIDACWVDEDGAQLWETPAPGEDYTLELELGADEASASDGAWIAGDDGLYYWSLPVERGASTGVLIRECAWTRAHGDDRLKVTVSVQGVGAEQLALWGSSVPALVRQGGGI